MKKGLPSQRRLRSVIQDNSQGKSRQILRLTGRPLPVFILGAL